MYIPNRRASIESLPLKLIIICIITSITIPALWNAFSSYSKAHLENELRAEIYRITGIIKQVWVGANGTAIKTEINLKNVDYVKMGDRLGGEYSTEIRYKLSSSDEQKIALFSNIQITSNNSSLTLYSGHYMLIFTHINYDINQNSKIEPYERYVDVRVVY